MTHPKLLFPSREIERWDSFFSLGGLEVKWLCVQNKLITWNRCLGLIFLPPVVLYSWIKSKINYPEFYTCKFHEACVRQKYSWIYFLTEWTFHKETEQIVSSLSNIFCILHRFGGESKRLGKRNLALKIKVCLISAMRVVV